MKTIKKISIFLLTSLLVVAPISDLGIGFNNTSITYAANSTKKKSSTKKKGATKKKKSSSNNNINKKSTTKKNTTKKSTTSKKSASSSNKKYNYSSQISDDTTCYVSDGGKCYHRLSSCAGKLNQKSTKVGNVKSVLSKCKKCW